MLEITFLASFLGWCSIINMALLLLSFVALSLFRPFIIELHSKLTGVSVAQLPLLYFHALATYKIFIIVFNIVPYLVLKLGLS